MLYFYHGVMSSGKTAMLLMNDFEYRKNNMETLLLKPSIHKREDGIKSRIGLSGSCIGIDSSHSIIDIISTLDLNRVKVILVDEAQFLTKEQANELAFISHKHKIDILCYGLMLSYKGEIFDGAKYLIEAGAKLYEIKSCGQTRLTHHIRYVDGVPVFNGDTVESGKSELYKSVDYITFKKEKGDYVE